MHLLFNNRALKSSNFAGTCRMHQAKKNILPLVLEVFCFWAEDDSGRGGDYPEGPCAQESWGGNDTIIIIRLPQNGIGNYFGSYIPKP